MPRLRLRRIVIVSRGGPASWYAHLGGRYFDVIAYPVEGVETWEPYRAQGP